MATGDGPDMLERLRRALPTNWFPTSDDVLDTVLSGFAAVATFLWNAIVYAAAQTRLKTATDAFLDIAAMDFLGARFRRRLGETDDRFRPRLISEIFRERVTRKGLAGGISAVTGNPTQIIELWNPQDCGGYDVSQATGYDTAGILGTYDGPPQVLVRAKLGSGVGVPQIAGYGAEAPTVDPLATQPAGYDQGGTEFIDYADLQGDVTPQEIYDAANRSRAAGVIAWVQINP